MKNLILLLSLIFAFNLNANIDPNDFETLKQLEGKWVGTLERTDETTDSFILEFSIASNGSAILEESNTGGIEMLTIFNYQNDELLLTHYCGLQNKPVSKLTSSENGKLIFKTDDDMSGLSLKKDTYVTSWEIDLLPDDENKILYKYTVSGPDGVAFVATAEMNKI
jgi:hypothetical protein